MSLAQLHEPSISCPRCLVLGIYFQVGKALATVSSACWGDDSELIPSQDSGRAELGPDR